jgi:hypothetical protein
MWCQKENADVDILGMSKTYMGVASDMITLHGDITYPCTNRSRTPLNRLIRCAYRARVVLGTYIEHNLELKGESQ